VKKEREKERKRGMRLEESFGFGDRE